MTEPTTAELVKRLRNAFNTFPIIDDSPVELFSEAADRLEEAEATIKQGGLVAPEYLQCWIDRTQTAEQRLREIKAAYLEHVRAEATPVMVLDKIGWILETPNKGVSDE